MKLGRVLAIAVLGAVAIVGGARAQTQPPSAAVEEFAESAGAVIFAAGQLVIQARVCGGDEKAGHDMRTLVVERARQCASADPRVKDLPDNMDTAFNSMLKNADAAIQRRGKEVICTLYRSPSLQTEVAAALEMGRELATDAGHQRIGRIPCPPKD